MLQEDEEERKRRKRKKIQTDPFNVFQVEAFLSSSLKVWDSLVDDVRV